MIVAVVAVAVAFMGINGCIVDTVFQVVAELTEV